MNKSLSVNLALDTQPSAQNSASIPMPPQARVLLQMLRRLQHGALRLTCPDGSTLQFGEGDAPVHLRLNNWKPCLSAMKSGDIGFAESFIAGDWQTDDLSALLELLVRNRTELEEAIYGSWWGGLLYRVRHLFNRNSKAGSRRNIHAHYDIGNAFYRLWLDPSMTYSSALFNAPGMSLEAAQHAKYERILSELDVSQGARLLEIGCGWGGFAELATRQGMHLTGLTISTEQLAFAEQRLHKAGLAAQAELRLQDYRDVSGEFDGIASIEMFEAVGEQYWDSYFSTVAQRLKRGARACIQTITIDDSLFERYRKGSDFIQQYIFPGGMLPSPRVFQARAEQHGLEVVDAFAFGLDYARTLAEWHQAFNKVLPQVREQGFDDRFIRTWQFYLAYCEAGFRARNIDLYQFTLRKP
jgi:cyclopropane-fatty-acyl-phospholipid synthase